MLAGVAEQLCDGRVPVWGHYKFNTNESVGEQSKAQASTQFEQDLTCDSGIAIAKPGTPASSTPATEADRRDVEARTLDYLSKKDHGDFASADAMFSEDVISQVDRTKWREGRRAFNRESGLPKTRTVSGVTFYDDPADAPDLGRYAAVDYNARYGDRAFYCGYVVWLRQADGSYQLIREDESLAGDADVRRLTDAALASLMQQPGCRDSATK